MIPILYDKSETSFTSNGLGRLADCTSCTVTEERNGIYECQFTYPVTGEMYSEIQEGRILGVIHDDVHDIQPFDIYGRSAPINGLVTFYAHHISYRLSNIILKPMTAASCASALSAIPSNTYTSCPFSFWTDKGVISNWKNEVPNPVRAILGGQAGSILDVYGKGEYQFDKFAVRLYTNRGVDNGVSIRYGVNLTNLTHDIDTSGFYSAVVPFWKSAEDDIVVTLPEGYVRVNLPYLVAWTDNNGEAIIADTGHEITFNAESASSVIKTVALDLSESFTEQPTEEQLRAEASRRLINSDAWLPDENLKVNFIDLSQTEEYKNVAALQRVRLCDKVSVYCGPLGVSAVSMQVIRTVYNTLTERYDEIELGKAKSTFAQSIINDVEDVVGESSKRMESVLQYAINNATKQITGAYGGNVRFMYDANGNMREILIMDTADVETAVNVWRWNSGGLGFSSNGYGGPYETAITQDGKIVADAITTGSLSANIIKSGVIDGDLVKVKLINIINENGDLISSFADSITLGKANQSHVNVDPHSLSLISDGVHVVSEKYFDVSDMRDDYGRVYLSEKYTTGGRTYTVPIDYEEVVRVTLNGSNVGFRVNEDKTVYLTTTSPDEGDVVVIYYYTYRSCYYLTFGTRTGNNGAFSYALGRACEASGTYGNASGYGSNSTGIGASSGGLYTYATGDESFAYGYKSVSSGEGSFAVGTLARSYNKSNPVTASGTGSHAEGLSTTSSADGSHAEGLSSHASGIASHAEGRNTLASGDYSHAEGGSTNLNAYTTASGKYSHAEGDNTEASGEASHAEGYKTIAQGTRQHVFGRLNIAGSGIEIVGNGSISPEIRANARTLDWSGNEWIAGTLTQASDARLKEETGKIPDVSSIRARRFRWNDKKGIHDDKDHIGYFAQDVEEVAPYLVDDDAMGYKSLDYIGFLCAKVENLERRIAELEKGVN